MSKSEEKTWGNFIKKLIIQIILVFLFWAVGSNFVHMIGRAKPNKGNRYSPGHWDWPHNCNCYPYYDKSCLSKNDLGGTTKEFIKKHDEIHTKQNPKPAPQKPPVSTNQSTPPPTQSNVQPSAPPLDTPTTADIPIKANTSQLVKTEPDIDPNAPIVTATPVSTNTDEKIIDEKNVISGGARKRINKLIYGGRKRKNQRGGAAPEENKVSNVQEQQKTEQQKTEQQENTGDESENSMAQNMLGMKEKLQKRIIEEIFNDYDDYYVDGYGGESVIGPSPKLVAEWEEKNNTDAKNPILRAFIQTRNESVEKAEQWLKEAEGKVREGSWSEDYQLDDPVPQTLGGVGKLYLYTPLSTDEYGVPYNLQNDGRVSESTSGTCIHPTKTTPYSDGLLFGNPDIKTKNILQGAYNENKNQKIKGQIGGFQIGGTDEEAMSASAKEMSNEEMKRDIAKERREGIERKRERDREFWQEVDARDERRSAKNDEAFKKIKQKRRGKKGEEKDKTNTTKKKEPVEEMPEGFIEGIYNFLRGGWINLFTKGAPDIFGWVQEKSWIFHRWMIFMGLRFLATFYDGKPTGLIWVYVAFLIHLGPMMMMSSILPQIIGWISYIYTFLQYYLYGIVKDNHILTGWTWAGNFLFLPVLLGIVTGWIPILNIITIPISIILSFLPSLQTYIIPGITSFFQTIRTMIFLLFGHLFTPTGSQHYFGNILKIDRFRGLFILELVLGIMYTINNHLPTTDNIRNSATIGIFLAWLITQIIFFVKKRSGWNALIGR